MRDPLAGRLIADGDPQAGWQALARDFADQNALRLHVIVTGGCLVRVPEPGQQEIRHGRVRGDALLGQCLGQPDAQARTMMPLAPTL